MFAPHQAVEIPMMPRFVPTAVPALLSFVAGYIDSCMFLALFGLFVAQVTGSFVLACSSSCTICTSELESSEFQRSFSPASRQR